MLLALLIALAPAGQEGDAQAFTSLSDLEGKPLADGRYAQEVKDGRLHIEARYDFSDGRVVVERAVLRLHPQIEQESWDWTERKDGTLLRSYEVDLRTGKAVATRMDEKKRWRDDVDVEPGKTFAGIGFIVAVKSLRDQLAPGQKTELKAIAFTPRPRRACAPTASTSIPRFPPSPASSSTCPISTSGSWAKGRRRSCATKVPWSSPAIPSSASTSFPAPAHTRSRAPARHPAADQSTSHNQLYRPQT